MRRTMTKAEKQKRKRGQAKASRLTGLADVGDTGLFKELDGPGGGKRRKGGDADFGDGGLMDGTQKTTKKRMKQRSRGV